MPIVATNRGKAQVLVGYLAKGSHNFLRNSSQEDPGCARVKPGWLKKLARGL